MLKTTEIDFIIETLNALYPNPKPTLTHSTAFDLLVAVILSAQCTDERVNTITPLLQPITPEHLLKLGEEEVRQIIYPTGYYNSKTKALMGCAKALKGKEVPSDFNELTSLSGVGAKTAQVIQSQWFNIPAFPVDTHIHRICNRLGLADSGKNRARTERQAKAILPKEHWHNLHMQIIFHGRETCTAFKPKCKTCPLRQVCKYQDKNL
jgi:endonuclease III